MNKSARIRVLRTKRKSIRKLGDVGNGTLGGPQNGIVNTRRNLHQKPIPDSILNGNVKIFFFPVDGEMEAEDLKKKTANQNGTCIPICYSIIGDRIADGVTGTADVTSAAKTSQPHDGSRGRSKKGA